MTKDPASGNGPALPSLADIHTRSLYVLEAFELIEKGFDEDWKDSPVLSICAAFRQMAIGVADDLERLAAAERQK